MGRLVDDAGSPDGYAALVDRFAAGPSRRSLTGRFDEALNLLEYVVHHEDLRRGTGPVPPRALPAAELDEIWRRARPVLKRAYRKAPVGVELAPDGGAVTPVQSGPSTVTVAGSPIELLLHAFGDVRRRVGIDGSSDAVSCSTDGRLEREVLSARSSTGSRAWSPWPGHHAACPMSAVSAGVRKRAITNAAMAMPIENAKPNDLKNVPSANISEAKVPARIKPAAATVGPACSIALAAAGRG